jgi:hypothetical protein
MRIVIRRNVPSSETDSETTRVGVLAVTTECLVHRAKYPTLLYAIQVNPGTVEFSFDVCCAASGMALTNAVERPDGSKR